MTLDRGIDVSADRHRLKAEPTLAEFFHQQYKQNAMATKRSWKDDVGRFQRVEDLLRVKGVGRATVKKWRPLITLGSTGSAAHADAGGAT